MSTNDLKVPSIRASERLQRQTAAVGRELLIASVVPNRSSALRVDANDAVPAVRLDGVSKVYGRGNSAVHALQDPPGTPCGGTPSR